MTGNEHTEIEAEQPLEPTLDRLIAQQGPMPEGAVLAMGVRLAEALAGMHALRQVFGDLRPETVLVYPDGPRLGSPRPSAQPAAGPAADVGALAAVLVFAATGRTVAADGTAALPSGLRTALGDALSEFASSRPTAADLARALAAAAPAPIPPEPAADQVAQPIPPGPTVPIYSEPTRAQQDSKGRLPWILAGGCVVLIVAILAIVGVVVATRDDGDKASGGSGTSGGKADPAVKYTSASIGDACALLDFPALEKYIGKTFQNPVGNKIELPTVGDTLDCMPINDHGFVLLNIEVSDNMDMVHQLYDGHRSEGLGTTGSGVTTGTVPGIGEDAFQVIHEPNKGNSSEIGCSLGFLKANVVAIVDVNIGEDDGTGRDKLAEICQAQARTVLGRLK